MRYAIYFTPGPTDRLTRAAAEWLGRDAFSGDTQPAPALTALSAQEIAYHTASARRYGFHATLKAPFYLTEGKTEEELEKAVALFAAEVEPVVLPQLTARQLDGFLALVPGHPSPDLNRLAGDVVTRFDAFRAPLSEADIKRRNPDALSPDQFRNLLQWGYPYVFESFRFHMTLTGRVSDTELPRVLAAVDEVFGPLLDKPIAIDGLALFVEPEPGAPFLVKAWHELGSVRNRKTA